jgi:fatty-acyl-CoA synthase
MRHADILGERARLTPDAPALVSVDTGERLTYAMLDRRAQAVAWHLTHHLRLAPGDRVGLLAANSVTFVALLFAAAKSGVVLVPLSTRLTAHELEPVIRDSGMRALIFDADASAIADAMRAHVSLTTWVPVADIRTAADRAEPFPWSPRQPDDLFALLYTSGTTGTPKGVMIPHRMIAWNAWNTVVNWQLRGDDVSAVFTPLYHAGGMAAFLMPIFAVGGTIVLHSKFDSTEVWNTIARERCTVVLGVPTLWKMLLEDPAFAMTDVSSVRWFISGGAPLPDYLAEAYRARGIAFTQGYGLTEVGVNCFALSPQEAAHAPGSIGRPMMMTEARLVDEQGQETPAGEVGELCLRGPHVCAGYWQQPALTASVLDAGHWFHTGDLARRDDAGRYYIAGRRKDMFISGGVNVYPAEIEGELLQAPTVADAAVVGVPDPTWGEVPVAVVVWRDGVTADPDGLRAWLHDRLARFKVPRRVITVPVLPRTPTGKVQKDALAMIVNPLPLTQSEIGEGTAVLLLNGGLMSIAAWDPVALPLAASHRVIRCDLRGQLLSPGPVPATLSGHAADVAALIERRGEGAVHVAGTSFGGLIAMVLAIEYPHLVRSLIVMTATERVTPEMWDNTQRLRALVRQAATGCGADAMMEIVEAGTFSTTFRTTYAAILQARRQALSSLPASWFTGLDGLLADLEGVDLRAQLARIRCPTTVVAGEHDLTFPLEHSKALAAGIPGAHLEVVPRAPHGLVIEHAAAATEIIGRAVAASEGSGRIGPS